MISLCHQFNKYDEELSYVALCLDLGDKTVNKRDTVHIFKV